MNYYCLKIQKFFLDEYQPTPIVAPWNGGSGFFTGDNKKAIELISNSNSPRFTKYRMVITKVKEVLIKISQTGFQT